MSTIAAHGNISLHAEPVAHWWHTALLFAFFLLLTLSGIIFQRQAGAQAGAPPQHHNMVPLYLSLIAGQWGLLYYVWKGGLRRTETKLGELIGKRYVGWKDVLLDALLGLGLWIVWMILQTAWNRWFGSGHAASIRFLLPQRPVEVVLWIALSISAGFCEEVIFRGYFQRQFEALTRNVWIALFLQSVLFGVSHGYQGVNACLRITLYGGLFGLLALWRQSLRPCIAAHALTDIVAGVVRL